MPEPGFQGAPTNPENAGSNFFANISLDDVLKDPDKVLDEFLRSASGSVADFVSSDVFQQALATGTSAVQRLFERLQESGGVGGGLDGVVQSVAGTVEQAVGNGSRVNGGKTNLGNRPTTGLDPTQTATAAVTGPEVFLDSGSLSPRENEAAAQGGVEVTNSQPLRVEPIDRELTIPENPLLDYVSLQYHLVLSMIPEPNVVKIQRKIPEGRDRRDIGSFDVLQQALLDEGAIPFASTGDVFQADFSSFEVTLAGRQTDFSDFAPSASNFNESPLAGQTVNLSRNVDGRNYYNIESMEFTNSMAPSPTNPFLAEMMLGKMTIVEPHGFKLAEDIRRVGSKIGYVGISPGRILWRLDIFFSGYNQDTGEWVPFIEMDTRVEKTRLLTYYIHLTTMEAKLSHTGTTYETSFAPAGHSAYRPEEIHIDAGAIFTGSAAQAETFGGFLDRLKVLMEKAVRERTNDQVKRIFEFKAPAQLRAATFYTGAFEAKHNYLKNDPKGGSAIPTGRDVTALSLIEDALQDLTLTWEKFLKKDDKRHLEPRITWGIRFNVVFDSGPNPGLNDYEIITNQYIIEPFVTYKNTTMNNRQDVDDVTRTQSQLERVKKMIGFGMINRIYDYINTPLNHEVIDIDLGLKNFYYHTLFNPQDSSVSAGIMQGNAAFSKETKRLQDSTEIDTRGTKADSGGTAVPSNRENTTANTLRRLFGSVNQTPAQTCDNDLLNTPFDVLGGGFGEMPKTDQRGAISGNDQIERQEYIANFNDHIRNDLLKIDLQVQGDPIWLLTPYGSHSGNLLAAPDRTNNAQGSTEFVQTQSSRCFFLRMYAPAQEDYMNPAREAASSDCSIIGGFYEAITVTSRFQGGKFIQTINAGKLQHLNYVENYVTVVGDGQAGAGGAPVQPVNRNNTQPTFVSASGAVFSGDLGDFSTETL